MLSVPVRTCGLLKQVRGRLEPVAGGAVWGQPLLADTRRQVEQHGGLLQVYVVGGRLLVGAERVVPGEVDAGMRLVGTDGEARLDGCQAAVIPEGKRRSRGNG